MKSMASVIVYLILSWTTYCSVVDINVCVDGYLPPQNPPWPPTYKMSESLITMQCNSSGFSSPSRGAQFGIVSYDWSNAKAQWAATKPMDCEERLVEQAVQSKAAGVKHVFVYRNLVKALPWFSSVREKLLDPAYSGFFLPFASSHRGAQRARQSGQPQPYHVPPCAAENSTRCSRYYHDQEQTPQAPTPEHPNPDGVCVDSCDCGPDLPCGEYLFDHRNGTMLRNWLVREYLLGPTAVGHPAIDGLFLDDFWCSDLLCKDYPTVSGCPCDDPVQGPTEIDKYSQLDMGLSDQDILDITLEWNITMKAAEEALLDHGAYTWWLMEGQQNANAQPFTFPVSELPTGEVVKILKDACKIDSSWQRFPKLFGFVVHNHTLTQLDTDWVFFHMVRGQYAWAGWGEWGMTWPFQTEPAHGGLPPVPGGVPLPNKLLNYDLGTPLGICYEISPDPFQLEFQRDWSKGSVFIRMDVADGNVTITSRLKSQNIEIDFESQVN